MRAHYSSIHYFQGVRKGNWRCLRVMEFRQVRVVFELIRPNSLLQNTTGAKLEPVVSCKWDQNPKSTTQTLLTQTLLTQ